jgi:hypothetical protein
VGFQERQMFFVVPVAFSLKRGMLIIYPEHATLVGLNSRGKP